MLPEPFTKAAEMEPGAGERANYQNDFFGQAYGPWLTEHPEHWEAASRLAEGLRSGEQLRLEQDRLHGVPIPETLVISLTVAREY